MAASKDRSIMLPNVRLSYFYGFLPMTGKNDKGQDTSNYCTHAIMGPDHLVLPAVKALIKDVGLAAWADQATAVLTQLAGQDRLCLHKGDVSKAGQDGYAGNFYISANSKVRPTIIDGNRAPLVAADGRPYSGCYANVMVNIWAQTGGGYGKRINAQLMGVQFLRHGEAFGGGRVAAPEEFGVVASDADGAEPAQAAGDATDDLLA